MIDNTFIKKYFDNFNETDLRMRGCISKDQCMESYFKSLRKMSRDESRKVKIAIIDADKLSKYLIKFFSIPWHIIVAENQESNYPHTHGDLIVLSALFIKQNSILNLTKTLLHEKMHIFQRLYPTQCNTLILKYWGFKIVGMKNMSIIKSRARSNPDINDIIYADNNGIVINNDFVESPMNLSDIHDRRDHPYEMMAYMFPDILIGSDNDNNSMLVNKFKSWMKIYM